MKIAHPPSHQGTNAKLIIHAIFSSLLLMAAPLSSAQTTGNGKILISPVSGDDKTILDDISKSGAEIKLAPLPNGRWKLTSGEGDGNPDVKLPEASGQPAVGEGLPSVAYTTFLSRSMDGKTLLESKLVDRWHKFSSSLGNTDKRKSEIDNLVAGYAANWKSIIERGDLKMYQPPSADPKSELGKITSELRDKLLARAGEAADPLSLAAARTYVDMADEISPQGLARGMVRVSRKGAKVLETLSSGVAEVVLGNNATIGVCTRSSKGACITSFHVVSKYAASPGQLSVRFHMENGDGEMVSVNVKVAEVKARNGWVPVNLKHRPDEEPSLMLDYAFLILDPGGLTEEEQLLLKKAAVADVTKTIITPGALVAGRQFFQISYDPLQSKVNGPQIQYRCPLLCPVLTQSAEDEKQIYYNLFERCLISNREQIEGEAPNLSSLCSKPLKNEYMPQNYLSSIASPGEKYFAPTIDGFRRLAISYEVTSFGGDSGAPVFWYDESLDKIELVAIHLGADESKLATSFSAKRSAFAAPVCLIHPDDRKAYCGK